MTQDHINNDQIEVELQPENARETNQPAQEQQPDEHVIEHEDEVQNPGGADQEPHDEPGNAVQNQQDYNLVRDRERRVSRPTQRFGFDLTAYAYMTGSEILDEEPRNFTEACQSKNKDMWKSSMAEELNSLKLNHTWTVVNKPAGKKIIGSKWIFKVKEGIPGDWIQVDLQSQRRDTWC